MEILYAKIGYKFKNPALLSNALRHRSASKDNNERLEFLGDAVLGLVVSDFLFQHKPKSSEGELSRIRASLVQQSTLVAIARDLQLGDYLVLGAGELKSGGGNRESILADAVEALICAIYLDAGLDVCTTIVMRWLESHLHDLPILQSMKDPKTRLQELLQRQKAALPVYEIDEVSGKDHLQNFRVTCTVDVLNHVVTGTGSNRKHAEQNAAAAALELLDQSNGRK